MYNSFLDDNVKTAQTICIVGHTNPDGDCIGSTLACFNYLRKKYPDKQVKVYHAYINDKFSIIPGNSLINTSLDVIKYDLCIICDCSDEKRSKDFKEFILTAKKVIVIDHHKTSADTCPYENVILPEASSTCEVLYEMIDETYFDKDIAACLYVGIISDTGCFRYSATSTYTMAIASKCMETGIPFNEIVDNCFCFKTFIQAKLYGVVLASFKQAFDGKIVYSYISSEDLVNYHGSPKDVDGIVAFLRETTGAKACFFCYEINKNVWKVSLRSNTDDIDVSKIAANHGGGGHSRAAGCFGHGDIDKVCKNYLEEFEDVLNGRNS